MECPRLMYNLKESFKQSRMPYKPKPHYGGPKPATGFRPSAGPRPAGGRGPRPFVRQKADDELNINEEITASQVRLVGDNIAEPGIYPISKALKMADELELDLVEISAKADPPVCKILDYQKYLYQQRKKAKEMKQNASKIVIKEIRFGPNTDEHDFQFKLKHAQEFLEEGSKSRQPYSSAAAPSCSPNRGKSSCCVSRLSLRNMAGPRTCRPLRERG